MVLIHSDVKPIILELFSVLVNDLYRLAQWDFRIAARPSTNSRLPGERAV
jgi:hypothetical protein